MANVNNKQKLIAAEHKLSSIFNNVVRSVGIDTSYQLILESLEEELYDLDMDITEEEAFIRENATGAYKSAGTDAKKYLKHLKNLRKEQLKLIKTFEQFVKQHKKCKR